jgi:hypothetical protein
MFLKTRQANAADRVAERWKTIYYYRNRNKWMNTLVISDTESVYNQLAALGPTPNPDDVDRIIGNDTWTDPGECDECGKPNAVLVEVGELPDYESCTATICTACLEAALKLAKDAQCDSPAAPPKP